MRNRLVSIAGSFCLQEWPVLLQVKGVIKTERECCDRHCKVDVEHQFADLEPTHILPCTASKCVQSLCWIRSIDVAMIPNMTMLKLCCAHHLADATFSPPQFSSTLEEVHISSGYKTIAAQCSA